ncbi:acetolactate synthase large subunit [Bacillus sp. ISL-47]|uniref:acetolactate synthase large subunit n=1 Tax=Bacillus sp. ISL-47 TaxID=2819130 RepID=UPI001BE6F122|nr:acetolactate synthase large subunit [Bacillus sp. ISL-47]MBT2687375.1 acetolactate synthase large subunit [Bacillus sp. ISL-47]MBT2706554.1 acetolactate synthase large subunit [Pseudomonas sp. ISL-84]
MNAAQLLIKCLENEGVEYIFGVPGEENLDIMDALLDSSIEFIVTRHETNAAFMAGTYGRLTGKPGVCLATLGPGATNLLTGVANANMDHCPLIAITGQAGLDRQHKISHQYYDLVSVFEPVTKWNTQVKTADIIPEVVRKAFRVATTEKPGATHIDLPEDIAAMEVEASPLKVMNHSLSEASERVIQEAAKLMEDAKHPLILAGMGVERGQASDSLRALVEKTQIPVVHTFMGKGALSWRNELSLLTAGLSSHDYITCGFREADLIITIGFDMAEYPPKNWNPGGQTPILHIDTIEAETDANYPVKHHVIGDIKENLQELNHALSPAERDNKWVANVRSKALSELESFENDAGFPVKPQKMISDLREVLNDDDIVISDVGAHKMWMARMYHTYEPHTCLISNGLASMGIAVPGAIAAKMAHPDKNVVAVCGDGAFQMSSAELETAKRLDLPIVILLWRDEGYGLIEWKQLNEFNRSSHVKFGNPDFIQLAKSYGFEAIEIQDTNELKSSLEKAVGMNKPVLIDCPVDYSENMKLTEKLGKILC